MKKREKEDISLQFATITACNLPTESCESALEANDLICKDALIIAQNEGYDTFAEIIKEKLNETSNSAAIR